MVRKRVTLQPVMALHILEYVPACYVFTPQTNKDWGKILNKQL